MASTYLSKANSDPIVSNTTATFSVWVKRSNLSSDQSFFGSYLSTDNMFILKFSSDDKLQIYSKRSASVKATLKTTRLLRDTNAWYHIVISIDTTQATAADRIKVYINGVQETSFSTNTQPIQNENLYIDGGAGTDYYVGQRGGSAEYFDGSLTHFHCIIGTAYDASTFGETDATTGIWKPKTAPSVTYGTKGFFLKFENSGSMGTDSSGNANNFTVNGNLTQTEDTPSNVFATMNVLSGDHDEITTTNGNLTLLSTTQTNAMASTLGVSQGKYYWEAKINGSNTQQIGIIEVGKEGTLNDVSAGGSGKNGYILLSNGDIYNNGSVVDTGSSFTTNDIIGIALDLDTNYIYFYKNGTLTNSGGTSIVNRSYFAVSSAGGGSDLISASYNFGNGYFGTTAVSSAQNPDDGIGIFEYDVPTGYRALCTKSINAEEYS